MQPTASDVLCYWGPSSRRLHHHPGNKTFAELIRSYMVAYSILEDKASRLKTVRQIAERMRNEHGARFLKKNGQAVWEEISEFRVRDKISHALRNAAHRARSGRGLLSWVLNSENRLTVKKAFKEGGLLETLLLNNDLIKNNTATPLHILVSSHSACCDHEDFSNMVELLAPLNPHAIRNEVPPSVPGGGLSRLPLHVACTQPACQAANLKTLLDLHKPALVAQDANGATPLDLAIWNGQSAECLYVLLRESPDALQTMIQRP